MLEWNDIFFQVKKRVEVENCCIPMGGLLRIHDLFGAL
jgi:hypothetical protein